MTMGILEKCDLLVESLTGIGGLAIELEDAEVEVDVEVPVGAASGVSELKEVEKWAGLKSGEVLPNVVPSTDTSDPSQVPE